MKVRTKRKNIKYKRLEKENIKYKEIIETLQSKIRYDDYLKQENKKLIEWIQKILEEFGTLDVKNRERVKIPIMKYKYNHYGDNNFKMTTRTIIIPEIVISQSEY